MAIPGETAKGVGVVRASGSGSTEDRLSNSSNWPLHQGKDGVGDRFRVGRK